MVTSTPPLGARLGRWRMLQPEVGSGLPHPYPYLQRVASVSASRAAAHAPCLVELADQVITESIRTIAAGPVEDLEQIAQTRPR